MKDKTKRLYRSENEKMVAGVCGGLAEYFKVDPVIIRLIAVALVFVHGIGVLAYLIGWIVMPLKSEVGSRKSMFSGKKLYRSESDRMIGGVCGGLAKYLDIDSAIVRLFMILFLLSGIGLIVYLVAWVIVPLEAGASRDDKRLKIECKVKRGVAKMNYRVEEKKKNRGWFVLGLGGLLVLIGFSNLVGADVAIPYGILIWGFYLIYRSIEF